MPTISSPANRQARLILLLDAAEKAGLTPITVVRFHAFAYLANVLAPVWDMSPLDGRVLKRRISPFYPGLQSDLDKLVGAGMVAVTEVGHVQNSDGNWQIEAMYTLNRQLAEPAVELLSTFDDERQLRAFIQELAYALSALSDHDLDTAATQDAAYSDPLVSVGNVLDFGEWSHDNSSVNAALSFDSVTPEAGSTTAAEKLHMYAQTLLRRLSA